MCEDKDTEEPKVSLEPRKRRTDEDLIALAKDILAGRVFGTWDMAESDVKNIVGSVFIPLALGARDKMPIDIGAVYEYYDKATPMGLNGYPVFMSCHFLVTPELDRLQSIYNTLRTKTTEMNKEIEDQIRKDLQCSKYSGEPTKPTIG